MKAALCHVITPEHVLLLYNDDNSFLLYSILLHQCGRFKVLQYSTISARATQSEHRLNLKLCVAVGTDSAQDPEGTKRALLLLGWRKRDQRLLFVYWRRNVLRFINVLKGEGGRVREGK